MVLLILACWLADRLQQGLRMHTVLPKSRCGTLLTTGPGSISTALSLKRLYYRANQTKAASKNDAQSEEPQPHYNEESAQLLLSANNDCTTERYLILEGILSGWTMCQYTRQLSLQVATAQAYWPECELMHVCAIAMCYKRIRYICTYALKRTRCNNYSRYAYGELLRHLVSTR